MLLAVLGKLAGRGGPHSPWRELGALTAPPVCSLRLRPCYGKASHHVEAPGHPGLGGGGGSRSWGAGALRPSSTHLP